ncbi:Fluconazole resistance protein 1 [Teratosphaeriaceae sp. CCFEE 6253]|nr:Fluconazole resistance protein 1 [Teratosphaeriaceae sp. CCFEE 6253]
MASPSRTASQDSADGIRKRVCRACDRCRLKKSKCDGTSPCSRCRADNAICVFGERKKSHDKVYPKGYVEMLEQQQGQLVTALQETYRRLKTAQAWPGPSLSDANGQPLTHDILLALGLLESKADGSGDVEPFEEDCQKLQSRLLADGAGYVHRRGSVSSESEHSHHSHARSTPHGTPALVKPEFRDSFAFQSATSSPLSQSPVPRPRQTYPLAQPSPLSHDPQFYQADWMMPGLDGSNAGMQAGYNLHAPQFQQSLSRLEGLMANDHLQYDQSPTTYDANFGPLPIPSFPQQQPFPPDFSGAGLPDFSTLDPAVDLEYASFCQSITA